MFRKQCNPKGFIDLAGFIPFAKSIDPELTDADTLDCRPRLTSGLLQH